MNTRLVVPLLVASVLTGLSAAPAAPRSSCVTCHAALDDSLEGHLQVDVHQAAGLGCEACHGGDPSPALAEDAAAAMSEAQGFRPAPGRLEIAAFCASCHADAAFMKKYDPQARVDQLAEYRTSVHGRRNADGDPVPATCIDCHGSHGIRAVSSPEAPVYPTSVPETCGRCHADATLMASYGIPTDQLARYRRSVHAGALLERGDTAAPACNDCHGNHGAAPPGVQSVAFVCGQCHGREAVLFAGSLKKRLFESLELAECTVCHAHHDTGHPTPEMFHGASAPEVSSGKVVASDPFVAEIGDLEAGMRASASWGVVLGPHLEPTDPRLAHRIEVSADEGPPMTIDATVRPGDRPNEEAVRVVSRGPLSAELSIVPISGTPVEAGDAIRMRVELTSTAAARRVVIRDVPAEGVDPVPGSVCLTCHSPGDPCDQASERMYAGLSELDRDLRQATALLHRAEIAGMEVSQARFELKSKGTTAAVEARALIHAFDPPRLLTRIEEGRQVAAAALAAGNAALDELQYRRQGLAVSLVLVVLVLAGLFLKIRQVDRTQDVTRQQEGGKRI
jgi:hypothetical protein